MVFDVALLAVFTELLAHFTNKVAHRSSLYYYMFCKYFLYEQHDAHGAKVNSVTVLYNITIFAFCFNNIHVIDCLFFYR